MYLIWSVDTIGLIYRKSIRCYIDIVALISIDTIEVLYSIQCNTTISYNTVVFDTMQLYLIKYDCI